MSQRNPTILDEVIEEKRTISMDYPHRIALEKLLKDASKWSGKKFIMAPQINRYVQVFAPDLLDSSQAFQLLIATLETVGLRAIPYEGEIIKIVESSKFNIKI